MDALIFLAGCSNDLRPFLASIKKTDLARIQYFVLKDKFNKKEEHYHYNKMILKEVERLKGISEGEIKVKLISELASIFDLGEINLETHESIEDACQKIIVAAYKDKLKNIRGMESYRSKYNTSELETLIIFHLKDSLEHIMGNFNSVQIMEVAEQLYRYIKDLPDEHISNLKKILEVQELDIKTISNLLKFKRVHTILDYMGKHIVGDPLLTISSFLNIGNGLSFQGITLGTSFITTGAAVTSISGIGTSIAMPSLGALTSFGFSQASVASLGAVQASLLSGVGAATSIPVIGATTGLAATTLPAFGVTTSLTTLSSLSVLAGPLAFAPLLISGGLLIRKNSKLKKKIATMTLINIGLLGLIECNKD